MGLFSLINTMIWICMWGEYGNWMDPMGPLDGGPCHGNSCVLVLTLYFKKVTPKDMQKCTHKLHRVGLAHCTGAYIRCTVAYVGLSTRYEWVCIINTILIHFLKLNGLGSIAVLDLRNVVFFVRVRYWACEFGTYLDHRFWSSGGKIDELEPKPFNSNSG